MDKYILRRDGAPGKEICIKIFNNLKYFVKLFFNVCWVSLTYNTLLLTLACIWYIFIMPYQVLKLVTVKVTVLSDCDPMDCTGKNTGVGSSATSFSRGSSFSRDQTQVSHIAGRCFNLWASTNPHSIGNNMWLLKSYQYLFPEQANLAWFYIWWSNSQV